MWNEKWAKIYEKDSKSRKIIEGISDNYFLVNLVDNEFPQENILWKVLDDMLETVENQTSVTNGIENGFKVSNKAFDDKLKSTQEQIVLKKRIENGFQAVSNQQFSIQNGKTE